MSGFFGGGNNAGFEALDTLVAEHGNTLVEQGDRLDALDTLSASQADILIGHGDRLDALDADPNPIPASLDLDLTKPLPSFASYQSPVGKHYSAPLMKASELDTPRYVWRFEGGRWQPAGVGISPAYTNLLPYSGDLTNAVGWERPRINFVNKVDSIGDISSPQRFSPTTEFGAHDIRSKELSLTPGIYNLSLFARAQGINRLGMIALHTGEASGATMVFFDLSNGSQTLQTGTQILGAGSEYAGDDWWRLWIEYSISALTTSHRSYFRLVDDSNQGEFAGGGTSIGVAMSGAQLTQSNYGLLPYIETQDVPRAIACDTLSIPIGYGHIEAVSVVFDVAPHSPKSDGHNWIVSVQSPGENFYVRAMVTPDRENFYLRIYDLGGWSDTQGAVEPSLSGIRKIGMAISRDSILLAVNGVVHHILGPFNFEVNEMSEIHIGTAFPIAMDASRVRAFPAMLTPEELSQVTN